MYKPNESHPERAKRLGLRLAAMTGLALVAGTVMLLQLPQGATAGVATGVDDGVAPPPPSKPAPTQKAQATYQLRCWQYGRLLFDEGPVTLSAETRQSARLVAFDRHGATLIVSDAGRTTCLARPAAAPRSLALPR